MCECVCGKYYELLCMHINVLIYFCFLCGYIIQYMCVVNVCGSIDL